MVSSSPIDIVFGQVSACDKDVAAFALEINSPIADEYLMYGDENGAAQPDNLSARIVDGRGAEHDLPFYYVMYARNTKYVLFEVDDLSLLRDGSTLRLRSGRDLMCRQILLMCYWHTDRA
jgi:hypothetical protein